MATRDVSSNLIFHLKSVTKCVKCKVMILKSIKTLPPKAWWYKTVKLPTHKGTWSKEMMSSPLNHVLITYRDMFVRKQLCCCYMSYIHGPTRFPLRVNNTWFCGCNMSLRHGPASWPSLWGKLYSTLQYNTYILLDSLVRSIAVYFYESRNV